MAAAGYGHLNGSVPRARGMAEPRWNPMTLQIPVIVKVGPVQNLPNSRMRGLARRHTRDQDQVVYAHTQADGDGVYDIRIGEFFMIDPDYLRANETSNYAGINVHGFTSLNNITTAELDRIQFHSVVTQPFSYGMNLGSGQTGQLSGQIAGTCTVCNNGSKIIPAGSRVMLTFPSDDNKALTIASNPIEKKLPITSPLTNNTLSDIYEGLLAIENAAGNDVNAALESGPRKQALLDRSGLFFPPGSVMHDKITRPLLELSSAAGGPNNTADVVRRIFSMESYLRRFVVGMALETSPPGKNLDILLSLR